MEPLPRIKARINSLSELRNLIRALRALAASRVQEARAALPGMRRYVQAVERGIAEGAALLSASFARTSFETTEETHALIAICSEHGFAGAFNERVLDRATSELAAGQRFVIIGSRGAILAEERGLEVAQTFPMASHLGGVLGVTRQVADYLSNISAADIIFGSHRQAGEIEVRTQNILPLDPALLSASARRSPPLHQLAPEELLLRLAGEYLFGEITHAVLESLAGENIARLRVMESADHNIGEKLEALGRKEHSLRQEAITAELLDVITGSEAMLGDAAR